MKEYIQRLELMEYKLLFKTLGLVKLRKEINTYVQQGQIWLVKNYSKVIYNVTKKKMISNKCCFLKRSSKNPEKKPTKLLINNYFKL